jgi:hypothetical protein
MTPSSHGENAPIAPGASRSALLWAIGGLGVAGAFLWCLFVIPGMRDGLPVGDGAVIELYTLLASRGWWEYGPYSRFGWHHPGPLVFYLMTPFYIASREQSLAVNAGAVAINLTALTTIVWALARHASAALCVSVTAAIALFLWRMPLLLVSAWNPHIVLLPLAALIASSSIVAAGRLSLLPVTIAMASFVSQTHLGLMPCAAAAVACALAAGLMARGPGQRRLFWLGVSALVGFVLWLPPIVEQVTNADGNMSKIARFFLMSDPAATRGPLMAAASVWAAAMMNAFSPGEIFPDGGHMARHATTPTVAVAMTSVALLIAAGWRTSRGAVDAWFCRMCALVSIVAFAAVVRIRDDVGDYMVTWVTVIGVMSIGALAAALMARVPAGFIPAKRIKWLVPVLTSICLIAASAHGLIGLDRMRAERLAPRSDGFRAPVDSVYTALRAFLAKTQVRRPLIRVAGTWDSATALVLQLHKRRQPVAVSDDALWLVGTTFAKNGSEDADLTLADRTERQHVRTRDGDCMLIERHGISLHVLLRSIQAPVSLTCE